MADFDGKTYDPALDKDRLTKQLGRVFSVLKGGAWCTLEAIEQRILWDYGRMDSQAGISARIRDLRKPKFGGYTIEARRVVVPSMIGGVVATPQWEYRMKRNKTPSGSRVTAQPLRAVA